MTKVPWGGGTFPKVLYLLLQQKWLRHGSSARLLGFLLNIRPSLGFYSLKIWGYSQAKRIQSIRRSHLHGWWRSPYMTRDCQSKQVLPTISWKVRFFLSRFSLYFVFFLKRQKTTTLVFHYWWELQIGYKRQKSAINAKKIAFMAKSKTVSFLKYMCNWNLKRSWFPFYLRRLISGSSLAIPSKIENLAHPQTHKSVDARSALWGRKGRTERTPTSADAR